VSTDAVAGFGDVDITLWRLDLDEAGDGDDRRLTRALSDDECARAARLRSPQGARRWIRAHGALREILATELGVTPVDVAFTASEAGKPAVAGASRLCFNLAHSAGLALVVLARDREVGVDVERIRGGLHEAAIARRIVGEDAQDELAAADPDRRTAEFFRLWVRHEAAVKCRGLGLAAAIGHDVSIGLAVEDVDVGVGYAAAWAIDGAVYGPVTMTPFVWSGEG
jgi:4'-phosphopantetheinyl transferase